jgi:phosphopantothenoylcysteine synthetase/decarboxylase
MDQPCEIMVMAAAVSDFQVQRPFKGKLPRGESRTIELTPTKDLIANFAVNHPDSFCIAFALAEDGADIEAISLEKLWAKGVSAVAGNTVSALGAETNELTLVTKDQVSKQSGTKVELGKWLVEAITELMSKA